MYIHYKHKNPYAWNLVVPSIENLQIPRQYMRDTLRYPDVEIQVNIVVDVSEEAYTAVVHLRYWFEFKIECAFISAKFL